MIQRLSRNPTELRLVHPSAAKIRISTASPFFFLNDPATPETYPLPLHDALPISSPERPDPLGEQPCPASAPLGLDAGKCLPREIAPPGLRLPPRREGDAHADILSRRREAEEGAEQSRQHARPALDRGDALGAQLVAEAVHGAQRRRQARPRLAEGALIKPHPPRIGRRLPPPGGDGAPAPG